MEDQPAELTRSQIVAHLAMTLVALAVMAAAIFYLGPGAMQFDGAYPPFTMRD